MASQAAVALENARLYEAIQKLFEGFVQASVVAIEARDPTTFGHSFRVEKMTVALAETVDRLDDGPYRDVKFTREQLREIRYASVLHDFGKVGVREEVLVKAKKLYPAQMDVVRERFALIREKCKQENSSRRLQYLLEKGRDEYLARQTEFDAQMEERLKEMDAWLQFVLQCNEPTVLPEGNFERLADLAATRYFDDWAGEERTLLQPGEVRLLSISKGSLDPKERLEIESHVVHTFNFLNQIPWTKEFRNVPAIARAHHEKLDGTGYPFKLASTDIPIQSRMMTISDIYDALSASDRPYKRAVPPEKALNIIEYDVKKNLIDPELFRIFLEKQLWKLTLK
jgi:response regulator RpfG family c-di-GMP phosphodiesterase